MLYSEFVERTGVTVDAKEYAAIEEVYYNFDGDKDEFCAWWCKGNESRVNAAKEKAKEAQEKGEKVDRFLNTLYKSATAKSGKLFWSDELESAYGLITNEFVAAFAKKANIEINELTKLARKCFDYACLSYRQKTICYAIAYRTRVNDINAF